MERSWLDEQLDDFAPGVHVADASLPPSSWYTDEGIYVVERRTVFRNSWLAAARAGQVREPGDFVAGFLADEPFVVVRGEDGVLRAFYNVCRHNAAALMLGEGCTDRLVCPYHGWTYGLDGRLVSAPELRGTQSLHGDEFGLAPMHVREWGALVFVSVGKEPAPWSDQMADLGRRLDAGGWGGASFVEQRSRTLECNWKVVVDHYLDGGYPVAFPPALCADPDRYGTEVFERFSVRSGAGAVHAWLYPNLVISGCGPLAVVTRVLPSGVRKTEVFLDYYVTDADTPRTRSFCTESLAADDRIRQEETEICRSLQRGLESSSRDRGRYPAGRQAGKHHFHRLLASDFAARDRGAIR